MGKNRNQYPTCATVEYAMSGFSRDCFRAMTEPTITASAPSPPSNHVSTVSSIRASAGASGDGSRDGAIPGAASHTQQRNSTNSDALITSADNSGDTVPGAPAWAGINQRCNGTSASFRASPRLTSASARTTAGWVRGCSAMIRDACSMSRVPVAESRSPTATRNSSEPSTAMNRYRSAAGHASLPPRATRATAVSPTSSRPTYVLNRSPDTKTAFSPAQHANHRGQNAGWAPCHRVGGRASSVSGRVLTSCVPVALGNSAA